MFVRMRFKTSLVKLTECSSIKMPLLYCFILTLLRYLFPHIIYINKPNNFLNYWTLLIFSIYLLISVTEIKTKKINNTCDGKDGT